MHISLLYSARRSQSTVEIIAANHIGEVYGKEGSHVTSIEQLAGITAQYNEIVMRVSIDTLDPVTVKRAFQNIIEGKLPQMQNWNPPAWWRTPEQQLVRAHQLWPNAILPEPPNRFTPWTTSEVLLLHVPNSFDSLWDKIDAPTGYTKYRWDGIKSDRANLRLAPNKREFTEPVWLAFDPEHGTDERPDSFWGQANIAASEVFSALIQFPKWPFAWLNGASAPNLTGYQLKYKSDWLRVPYLNLWDVTPRLALHVSPADNRGSWSSPSIREC